jgi:hypothetical protein
MGDQLLDELFDLNRLSADKQQRLRRRINDLIIKKD